MHFCHVAVLREAVVILTNDNEILLIVIFMIQTKGESRGHGKRGQNFIREARDIECSVGDRNNEKYKQ